MTRHDEIQDFILEFISREARMDIDDIDIDASLGSFGLSSVMAVKLIGMLEDRFGGELKPTMVFENPTVAKLSNAIAKAVAEVAA